MTSLILLMIIWLVLPRGAAPRGRRSGGCGGRPGGPGRRPCRCAPRRRDLFMWTRHRHNVVCLFNAASLTWGSEAPSPGGLTTPASLTLNPFWDSCQIHLAPSSPYYKKSFIIWGENIYYIRSCLLYETIRYCLLPFPARRGLPSAPGPELGACGIDCRKEPQGQRQQLLGDQVFRESSVPGNARVCGSGKSNCNLELYAPQTSSLHPRSHWSQYAAFPDMRISLMIWSSEAPWCREYCRCQKKKVQHSLLVDSLCTGCVRPFCYVAVAKSCPLFRLRSLLLLTVARLLMPLVARNFASLPKACPQLFNTP